MGKKRRDLVVILRLEEAVTLSLLGEVGLGPGGKLSREAGKSHGRSASTSQTEEGYSLD